MTPDTKAARSIATAPPLSSAREAGCGELEHRYIFRTYLSQYFDGELPEALLDQLPKWNKDALPGILPSVTAGRIANRFGFGGP